MSDRHDVARVCATLADTPQEQRIMVMALREAAAEIERLRAALEWRPIETAPHDTEVLLFCPKDVPNICCATFVTDAPVAYWAYSDELLSDVAGMVDSPTHWLPLHSPQESKP